MSENEKQNENEEKIPIARKIIHEIRDTRLSKPKPKPKIDDNNFQQEWFTQFKKGLAERLPEYKNEIMNAETGWDLEALLEDLKEDSEFEEKPPRGKATLPKMSTTYEYDLDKSSTFGSLVNKLYRASTVSGKQNIEKRKDAKNKIDTLLQSAFDSGLLSADSVGQILRGQIYTVCPQCGSIVEGGLNHKGQTCTSCGYTVGQKTIKKHRIEF